VLLEDVDAVFVDRSVQPEGGGRGTGVTFSGLLNALDGVASQEGRLFFMTTNHIEKLDPALIRPGRCDVKLEVRRASRPQARRLYLRFFPEAPAKAADAFAAALPEFELSMAALQGYLLEHKTDPTGALAHTARLLRTTKPLAVDRMTIFEHLRRVGLEGWAALFNYHGYHFKTDLRGLAIDTVKAWSGYMRIDVKALRRMELLLSSDEGLMRDYQLADMATIKELFIATFGSESSAALPPEAKWHSQDESTIALTDTDGSEQSFAGSVHAGENLRDQDIPSELATVTREATGSPQLSHLADSLCRALMVNGKAAASVWQVRALLFDHSHSAAAVLAHAPLLVSPAVPCGVDAVQVDELSAYDWLRRAGLEHHVDALEDKGYVTARSMYGLTDAILKEHCDLKNDGDRKALVALATADAAHPRTLLGFTSPGYARLRSTFLEAFPESGLGEADCATEFANRLSDSTGHSRISLLQLEAHLAKYGKGEGAGPLAALRAINTELLEKTRPERPAKKEEPEPTEWVYGWLKAQSLEHHAQKFIENRMCDAAAFQLEPQLDIKDLKETFGVRKEGEARRILAMVQAL